MQSSASTVDAYLAELPEDRRAAVSALREVILHNLAAGFEEGMQYGMSLPWPGSPARSATCRCTWWAFTRDEDLGSWFRELWESTGKKLDMGKSCVRFRRVEDVPLDVIGEAVRRISVEDFIAAYERSARAPR